MTLVAKLVLVQVTHGWRRRLHLRCGGSRHYGPTDGVKVAYAWGICADSSDRERRRRRVRKLLTKMRPSVFRFRNSREYRPLPPMSVPEFELDRRRLRNTA